MPINWDGLVLGPLQKVFGVPVTYMPAAGGSFTVSGVFDDAYLKEVMFDDATTGVTEVSAVVGVQLSQFSALPKQNDRLSVPSANSTFLVREVRQDGRGAAKLMLSRVGSP